MLKIRYFTKCGYYYYWVFDSVNNENQPQIQFPLGYYHSSGDDVRECGVNSQWDGDDFACKVKTCEKPAEIENGDFSPELDGYTYKSAVTFDCDYCHQASGKLEITCED